MAWIKVKWLKAHWDYAYFAGEIGKITSDRAAKLMEQGFILPLPDDDPLKEPTEQKVNTLPSDMPGRTLLFDVGYDTLEKVREAGDTLLDDGISKTTYRNIKKYLAGK